MRNDNLMVGMKIKILKSCDGHGKFISNYN